MKLKKKKSENAVLARKYRVTERTIRNWRAENAPISDPVKLSEWLASRKHCPKDSTRESAAPPAAVAVDTTPLVTGAAAALKRLEQAEAGAYRRLEQAIASNDSIAIRVARESWLKICTGLRQYEQAIDDHKRDRGLLIEKSQVIEALWFLGYSLRSSSEWAIPQVVEAIQAQPDIHKARTIARKLGWYNYMSCVAAGFAVHVPLWMLEAFCRDLDNILKSADGKKVSEDCARMGDALRELANTSARQAIEHTRE